MAQNRILTLEELIVRLYDVKGLKFGSFTMRTGEVTPVYIDMRVLCSYPDLTISVSELIYKKAETISTSYDHLCGIPYNAVPLSTYISTQYNIPQLLKRKEMKEYGTKNNMEGHYKSGDHVLIVDDVIMTGTSLVEAAAFFKTENLKITGTVAFIDREQGGIERIQQSTSMNVHCVTTISEALTILQKAGKLTADIVEKTNTYLQDNRFDSQDYIASGLELYKNTMNKFAKKKSNSSQQDNGAIQNGDAPSNTGDAIDTSCDVTGNTAIKRQKLDSNVN